MFGIFEFSGIVSTITGLLVSNNNFEVKFIPRQTNMVAHSL